MKIDNSDRDIAIDIARGVAILSMITGHFAEGGLIAKPFHAIEFFDGASAFVLLSGLLLGMVHRRRIDAERSFVPSRNQLIRRVSVIYICQIAISLLALAITAAGHFEATGLDMPNSGWQVVALRYLPPGGDVLSLYFVLMMATFGILPALRAGYARWVMAGSVVLYGTAVIAPYALWNYWASWQVLFVPAVVVGWYWKANGIGKWLLSKSLAFIAGASVLAAVSIGFSRTVEDSLIYETLVDKTAFGPGRVIIAWVFVPVVYVLIRLAMSRIPESWFRPLQMTGSRSLDAYVIQACLVMLLPLVISLPWGTAIETPLALAVFCLCWAWAEARRHLKIDKLHRAPSIVVRKMNFLVSK
ncbi:MAG: DUF1624 domain-containing protein [Rhodococcus sp. (in: high G+C Gram-positive bacteria)]|uniref:OpgC domain-containing protein n=1 Tax=Rhodococcus sp. TaxID=1831 RepID=UPI0011F4CE3E|nr:OpgC domain-containing protein [Rhodococcus sp. (in: high G+C Gram-positive bacteria)]RZL22677.1 MAG: DUF1624 domain-containing protein [Rhodococcus sp. (in: high G+C Gram-positive bacteria)]